MEYTRKYPKTYKVNDTANRKRVFIHKQIISQFTNKSFAAMSYTISPIVNVA